MARQLSSTLEILGAQVQVIRKRQKNMYLRLQTDGTVKVTCPFFTSDYEIVKFVQTHADWLNGRIQKLTSAGAKAMSTFEEGQTVRLWGRPLAIEIRDKKPYGVEIHEGKLVIKAPLDSNQQERRALFESFMRVSIASSVREHLRRWQPVLGVNVKCFVIRDMKSRWGSCNFRTGRLCFNIHLAEKDPKCLEYVVVHELCHLIVPNHSPAFWNEVAKCLPDWKKLRELTNASN